MEPRSGHSYRLRIVVLIVSIAAVGGVLYLLLGSSPSPRSPAADAGSEPERRVTGSPAATPSAPVASHPAGIPRAAANPTEDGSSLTARAVDRETGEPLRGASATATVVSSAGNAEGAARRRAEPAGVPGVLDFEALPAGTYELAIRAPNYLLRTVAGIVLAPGAAEELGDVALDRGRFVTGTVVDARDDTPVAGAIVRVAADGEPIASGAAPRGVTDDRGRFTLGPLAPGPAPIRVSRLGFQLFHLPAVQVPRAADLDLGRVALQPRVGTMAGDELGPAGPGIGIARREGGYVVRVVAPGSPASEAGVPEGSSILAIANYPAEDLSPDDVRALLHGEPGTRLTLQLAHPDWPQPRNYAIVRR